MRVSHKEAKSLGLRIDYGPKRKRRKKSEGNTGQIAAGKLFAAACKEHGLPEPIEEYEFCPGRKWRFDYCWPDAELALEVEGGVFTQGRHTRGTGFMADIEKYNEAAIRGWYVLRCVPQDVESGVVFEVLKRAMAGE